MTERGAGWQLFAVAPPGLEQIVAAELQALGMPGSAVPGGIEWAGDARQMRRANLQLRTASRVLLRISSFRARTFFELERHTQKVGWSSILSAGRAFTLRVSARKSRLYHEGAIAERLQRMIREATGAQAAERAPDDVEGEAAQLIVVRVLRDEFTISADTSGALLHRRGYRQEIATAPLRENLAAAMLRAVAWTGREALLDPFCGSGTIPIEAALLARRIAPGLAGTAREPRAYAFENWPRHDAAGWRREVQQARAEIRARADVSIFASDRNAAAIRAARANAERAGVEADITWTVAPLMRAPAPAAPAALVTNPPYGIRARSTGDLRDVYAALGHYVRERPPGWRVALLAADPAVEKQLRLPLHAAAETRNGGIAVRLLTSL